MAASAAEVTEDVQRLLQVPGRARVVPARQLPPPQEEEGIGLTAPVAEVSADVQRLLKV